jgi:alpha-mannosidase
VTLSYDLAAASNDDTPTQGGGFDGRGNALPAEMLRQKIDYHGVEFKLAPAETGVADALVTKGQSIPLPPGPYNRVYILAAAADGDQTANFSAGNSPAQLTIEDWGGFIGQWDTRIWKNEPKRDWAFSANHAPWPPAEGAPRGWSPRYPDDYVSLRAGFVKPAELGWYASHHHTTNGWNEPYQYSYLFAYGMELPPGAKTLTLPKNDKIRVFAISVAEENPVLTAAQPLYDTLRAADTTTVN